MSSIEYNNLLFEISRTLNQQIEREQLSLEQLLFMCREKVASGTEDNINDVLTLLRALESQDNLKIDKLVVLKELLKAVGEWSLFQKVRKLEIKRTEYNCLIEQVSLGLDELNDLERLILMCRGKTSVESEGNIHDARTLLQELERQQHLGVGCLDFLKEILTATEKDDLLQEVQEFEKRRHDEDEFERRKAQTADIVASAKAVGGKIIGVLNMKTMCRLAAAGITLLTVREVLSRWNTYDELVTCFNDCVLPAGTQLVEVSQGCVCFTVQADNLTGLTTLWNMYQDGTLKTRLRDFFVTDEMEKRAGGEENVEVAVTIEEEEYKKACTEFINETEGEVKFTQGQNRRHSDSSLSVIPREGEMSLIKLKQLENKFNILEERLDLLEVDVTRLPVECLGDRSAWKDKITSWVHAQGVGEEWHETEFQDETLSVIAATSDSGLGSHGTPSVFGEETISEPPKVAILHTTASTVPQSTVPAVTVGVAAAAVEHEETLAHFSLARKARQTQLVGGPLPPKRPDYGTVGRPIRLRANLFRLNISSQLPDLYHYDVEITPSKCPRSVKRDVVNEIIRRYKDTAFQGHKPAFDGEKNLYSRIKFPPAKLSVKLPGEGGGKDREFKVKIQFAASVSIVELYNFLSGKKNGKMPQDAVQALDIVMREMPSFYYTPVGRSFFPFGGQGRPLGEGCEAQFGFYSSVRHSQWKAMLLNIDVSAKGFYKEQPVIDFLCETLGRDVTPQSLQDRNFRLDKHKLEEAIRGIRIQTIHAATIKRKYTVWGVSSFSAEKLQFEIEDGATGRKSKTTVAQYFKDTYKLDLRPKR